MPAAHKSSPRKYQVPAVKRAFAILDSLNQSSFGLTVQEVSHLHKIPYSTAFYLLETMQECGYVQRNDSKKYTLGYKLFNFRGGNVARNTLNLRALAAPVLEELSNLTGLTLHLAILEKDEAVYIEKTEPAGFIRLNTWVGKRNSLHCTAVGKALLMHSSQSEIRKFCPPRALKRRTGRTLTSVKALINDLAKARERGYSIDDAEDEPEGRGVAAPILGSEGKVVASMGFAGTLAQLDLPRIDALGKLIKNYAAQLSTRLGYSAQPVSTPKLLKVI